MGAKRDTCLIFWPLRRSFIYPECDVVATESIRSPQEQVEAALMLILGLRNCLDLIIYRYPGSFGNHKKSSVFICSRMGGDSTR